MIERAVLLLTHGKRKQKEQVVENSMQELPKKNRKKEKEIQVKDKKMLNQKKKLKIRV